MKNNHKKLIKNLSLLLVFVYVLGMVNVRVNAAETIEVVNNSFESNLDGWTIEDPDKVVKWQDWGDGGNGSGSLSYGYCSGDSYEANTYQTITGLENGTYTVEAYASSGGGQEELYMYAKDFDKDNSKKVAKEDIPVAPYMRLTILEVKVTNNQMTIGFYGKGGTEEWSSFDNVSITLKQPDTRPNIDKIVNPSFVNGLNNWTSIGDRAAVSVEEDAGYDDDTFLRYYSNKDYEVRTEQTITGLENGNYRLEVYAASSGGQDNIYAYANNCGTSEARTSIPVDDKYRRVVVNFKVLNNKATIGFYSKAPKNSWTNFDNVKLFKVEEEFKLLKGGDLTEANYVEDAGGIFYDKNGNAGDVFKILADSGVNIARLRIYNKTGRDNSHLYEDGSEFYLPDGYQNKEDILKLAKRAKNVGMQIEISLHYSDWWTNGENQDIPVEWKKEIEGLDNDEAVDKLEELVYEYTKDIMQSLRDQGTSPEYVSVGNETQAGMLYPYGSIDNEEQLARFTKAGCNAIKEVNKDTQVILHGDKAGENARYYKYLDLCKKHDVNYDIIGTSYYPFWTSNTVEQIIPWSNKLYKKYGKKILFMETGYNWNETKKDGYVGQLSDNGTESHPSTQQGQKEFMDELFNGIRNADDNCIIGDLYWDPIMIDNANVGWAIEKGNAEDGSEDKVGDNVVSNTTLFDFDGKALKSLKSYTDNTEGSVIE